MVESSPPNPNSLQQLPPPPEAAGLPSPPPPPPPPPPRAPQNSRPRFSFPLPVFRLTSEFDSDSSIFHHKVSCKIFENLAKLKLSFQNNHTGEVSDPQLHFVTKYLSLHYDLEENNALVKGSFDVGGRLQFRAVQDVKAQQGEVAMITSLSDPSYKLELSSTVPSIGLPKATFRFPLGEVSLEEKEDEEVKRVLSINGILKGQLLNGVCTARYKDDDLDLRYSYKDEEISFIPSISLPSNVASLAFKRRFGPSDKLSYWYNFDSNYWSSVYKRTVGKDLKFKAGYDSEVRLGWASLWFGDEECKVTSAPLKMKVQFMLQVPQDDVKSSVLMVRVKKRWDF